MKALILLDLQNDFMPWGSAGIEKADEIIPLANQMMDKFDLVVAGMDWHPVDHQSFAANHPWRLPRNVMEIDGRPQLLWTIHCVQNTLGAELANGLDESKINYTVKKGQHKSIESYGVFCENDTEMRDDLVNYLKNKKVDAVYILGALADFGVKFSAIDAVKQGFETYVLLDACRWYDATPENIEKTNSELSENGVKIIKSETILS